MATLVNAYVIFNGTTNEFVGDSYVTISINCERLQAYSPRPVWLKRVLAPGDGTVILYEPTFGPSSDDLLDSNTLQGFWIEQDDQDTMIDVTTQAAFQASCLTGSPALLPSLWNGNVPDFTAPTLSSYCIYRLDNGSAGAHDAFAWDYTGNYVGTAQLRSNFSNTSHYTIQSFWPIAKMRSLLVGSDVIYAGACGS